MTIPIPSYIRENDYVYIIQRSEEVSEETVDKIIDVFESRLGTAVNKIAELLNMLEDEVKTILKR